MGVGGELPKFDDWSLQEIIILYFSLVKIEHIDDDILRAKGQPIFRQALFWLSGVGHGLTASHP